MDPGIKKRLPLASFGLVLACLAFAAAPRLTRDVNRLKWELRDCVFSFEQPPRLGGWSAERSAKYFIYNWVNKPALCIAYLATKEEFADSPEGIRTELPPQYLFDHLARGDIEITSTNEVGGLNNACHLSLRWRNSWGQFREARVLMVIGKDGYWYVQGAGLRENILEIARSYE